ncbi:MAG: DUF177 domain-containing protein [Trueperaceae bacterium]|nr:DUF177 domain-containing protein [Trueperaceae bacterium]
MVPRQDAILNLSRLLSHAPGLDPEVVGDGMLAPTAAQLEADGLRLHGPLSWHVVVRSTGGTDDFLAEGEVSGTAVMECRRCLSDAFVEVKASFIYPMVYRPAQEANLLLLEAPLRDGELEEALDQDDVLAFGAPEADFGPLLRQVFAIDLPLTGLCRPDCRGLSVDGVDLNQHPDHVAPNAEGGPASPFEVLKDLDVDSRS